MLKRFRSWAARLIAPAPVSAQAAVPQEKPRRKRISDTALAYAGAQKAPLTTAGATLPKAQTAFKMPSVPRGVIPNEAKMAADSAPSELFGWAVDDALSEGLYFPGYPYLSATVPRSC